MQSSVEPESGEKPTEGTILGSGLYSLNTFRLKEDTTEVVYQSGIQENEKQVKSKQQSFDSKDLVQPVTNPVI